MKIFIDCGAYRGTIIRKFQAARPGFRVYAFECNPTLASVEYGQGVIKINKAVWVKDEKISFYLSKTHQDKIQGSTVYKNKITGNLDKENPVTVGAIDFSKWMTEHCSVDDYTVVKMNIEGAEYDVIPKLIQDKTLRLISELHLQWHYQKINFPIDSHREILAALKDEDIPYYHGYEKLYTGVPS